MNLRDSSRKTPQHSTAQNSSDNLHSYLTKNIIVQ